MPEFKKRIKKEQVVVEHPVYSIELSQKELDDLFFFGGVEGYTQLPYLYEGKRVQVNCCALFGIFLMRWLTTRLLRRAMKATKTPGNIVVTLEMTIGEFNTFMNAWEKASCSIACGDALSYVDAVFYNKANKLVKAILYGGQEEICG